MVIVGFVVFQHAIVDNLRISGTAPDLLIILPVAGGYVAGTSRGTWFGFACGLVSDLFLATPFGLSALVGSLVAFGVAWSLGGLEASTPWLAPVLFAAATAVGLALFAGLAVVFGEPGELVSNYLPSAMSVSIPAALILSYPVRRAVAWALPEPQQTLGVGSSSSGSGR